MQQKPPWVLIATLIAGGGLSAIGQAFASALPANASLIANIVAILVASAGLVVTYYQAANAPGPSLQSPGPNGNIPVIDQHGNVASSVVTTTSTVPTTASQKGS